MSKQIPEGFTPWIGGERPFYPWERIEVIFDDGTGGSWKAGELHWSYHKDMVRNIVAYRREKLSIPEGFTRWDGGECPVAADTQVEVVFSYGGNVFVAAKHLRWSNHPDFSIIAYRVIEAEKPVVKIPKGFTPWEGGEIPVGFGEQVSIVIRNGNRGSAPAADLNWSHTGGADDIIAYQAIEEEKTQRATTRSAPDLLDAAAGHLRDRAATYDKPEGERSMAKTIAIFNLHHDTSLTEAQGWHLLQILKDVRLFTRETYHADSAEDCIAYAALKAESMQKGGV